MTAFFIAPFATKAFLTVQYRKFYSISSTGNYQFLIKFYLTEKCFQKRFFYSAPKSEFRNDRMKWLELPEWHGMIPKHLPKSQFQEIMNSWRYRLLHYTNTAMTLSENSFLVHLMSTLFSFLLKWTGNKARESQVVMQNKPSPGLRCELESRVYNLGSKSENYRFTWPYSGVSEFVESSSNMELVAWLNIWTKVMVLRINQAGNSSLEWNILNSGLKAELALSLGDFLSYFMTKNIIVTRIYMYVLLKFSFMHQTIVLNWF